MGVKLPDFMPDMLMLYSFRTYLLSRPIVDCHEVLSVYLQKRQFLAAILLSDDVEGFPSSRETLASFPGRFCGGEEKRPGHHCWRMRVVPIKTWEFVHVCTLSAYTLVISRNISVHDHECLSVLLQLRER